MGWAWAPLLPAAFLLAWQVRGGVWLPLSELRQQEML